MARDGVEAFLRERAALVAGAKGTPEDARELSDLTDRTVSALAEAALRTLRTPWAVLALGGWGARRLLPHSDLDLLVLCDAPPSDLKPALQAVLYPLWDAGLKVGHQVRTRRDHARAVREDVATLTASLTGRFLAGDAALAARVLADTAADARKRSKRVARELAARERPGSPYLLEPNLKEGAGGQRDLDELTWLGAVLTGAPASSPGALAAAGVISRDEADALARAGAIVTRARWAVHARSRRPAAVLTLQDAHDARLDGAALHEALADAHHLLLRVRARFASRRLPGDEPGAAPLEPDAVFALLDRGEAGLAELEDAAWSGRLDDLVPSFGELMHVRRPGLSHLYTVGAHSLRCATGLASLGATDATARRAYAAIADRRTVQVAALLHDAGKSRSGAGHAERGAQAVRTLGGRFRLSPEATADAALLVAEHLLLAETASGRDTHDEDVVLATAGHVRRADLVAPLLLLTIADSAATGPGAWTPWHAALIGDLADRLETALSDEVEGAGILERAEGVRAEVLAAAPALPDADAVARFARAASLRYLAAFRSQDVVEHARLAAQVAASGGAVPAATRVVPGPAEGTWQVSVALAGRPGAFASICGALALTGLDIMSAQAYDAPGGVALDVFIVRSDTLAAPDTATWAAFDRALGPALADPLALDVRLRERRRHYPPARRIRPRVETHAAESYATAVRVTAADRVGLLYDLARAFADTGLDIRWARALTQDGVARDVFHVTDAAGEPVDDPGVLGHLAMRIRERL